MSEEITEVRHDYIIYQWNGEIIPYNVWGDTIDSPIYATIPYKVVEYIRFMAENDVKNLLADETHIIEIERK